jgi:hypothetical protein
MSVDSTVSVDVQHSSSSSGGSDESRYPGSSDESPGDWRSYTSEDARGKKPTKQKGPEV